VKEKICVLRFMLIIFFIIRHQEMSYEVTMLESEMQ
jgi:hypothetical protein